MSFAQRREDRIANTIVVISGVLGGFSSFVYTLGTVPHLGAFDEGGPAVGAALLTIATAIPAAAAGAATSAVFDHHAPDLKGAVKGFVAAGAALCVGYAVYEKGHEYLAAKSLENYKRLTESQIEVQVNQLPRDIFNQDQTAELVASKPQMMMFPA